MNFLLGSQLGTKREVLSMLLDKGMVMLHLNATHPDVDVPPRHRTDLHLRLNLSHSFHIADFELNDRGVQATLSFGGKPHLCILPWEAIFAVTSHAEPVSYLWPDDLPAELADQAARMAQSQPDLVSFAARASKQSKPTLGVIRGGAAPDPDAPAPQPLAALQADDEDAEDEDDNSEDSEAPSSDDGGGDDEPPKPSEEGRRYGHLRVVK